jgi:hypothetical protein
MFPTSSMSDPEVGKKGPIYFLFHSNIVSILIRHRYLAVFYVSQAAIDACGFSYGMVEKGDEFTRIKMCDYRVELLTDPKKRIEYWNMGIQGWLRRTIFNRTIKRGKTAE